MSMQGCYIGTVVARSDISDKEHDKALGRVKVLIRNISDIESDINFINPVGENVLTIMDSSTTEKIKKNEVWAYVLQPNHGGSLGTYNKGTNKVSTNVNAAAGNMSTVAGDHTGPAQGTKDGAGVNSTNNDFAGEYKNNAAAGTYSIPPIGATVIIQFINGKRGLPVVMGTIHGAAAIESIYGAQDVGTATGSPDTPKPDYPTEYKKREQSRR